MLINPADDEINIFLPIAFLIFIGISLFIVGGIVSFTYIILLKLNVIGGKFLNKIKNFTN